MAHRQLWLASAGALLGLWAAPAHAQSLETVPFPFTVEPIAMVEGTFDMEPNSALFEALLDKSLIVMTDVPLPGAGRVDLTLERIDFNSEEIGMYVNGAPQSYENLDQTLWKGHVNGEGESEVFLSFASYGSYGWVRTEAEFHHMIAYADVGNDWSNAHARMVPDAVMNNLNVPELDQCQSSSLPQNTMHQAVGSTTGAATVSQLGTQLELKIAVETDYQYYQNWGNLTAAQNYTTALWGAISDRYSSHVD